MAQTQSGDVTLNVAKLAAPATGFAVAWFIYFAKYTAWYLRTGA